MRGPTHIVSLHNLKICCYQKPSWVIKKMMNVVNESRVIKTWSVIFCSKAMDSLEIIYFKLLQKLISAFNAKNGASICNTNDYVGANVGRTHTCRFQQLPFSCLVRTHIHAIWWTVPQSHSCLPVFSSTCVPARFNWETSFYIEQSVPADQWHLIHEFVFSDWAQYWLVLLQQNYTT